MPWRSLRAPAEAACRQVGSAATIRSLLFGSALTTDYRAIVAGAERLAGRDFVVQTATITFIETCGVDDDQVIACPPAQPPAGYADRRA